MLCFFVRIKEKKRRNAKKRKEKIFNRVFTKFIFMCKINVCRKHIKITKTLLNTRLLFYIFY